MLQGEQDAEAGAWAEVIGAPVEHSLSPQIHGHWLQALGLNARFLATHVDTPDLHDWLTTRRTANGWRGSSVTAPLKQEAMELVDELSDQASAVGALNLITCQSGRLVGHNTDVDGIRHALSDKLRRRGACAVIGAGGAMRAALAYAKQQQFKSMRVLARDPVRARANISSSVGFVDVLDIQQSWAAFTNVDLVINASPMGSAQGDPMRPEIMKALAAAANGAVVLDMVYAPRHTELLVLSGALNLLPVSGTQMLVGQAREAFRLLFGVEPPADDPLNPVQGAPAHS